MREIFFEEKLGETRRNSEGVQAARAEMGCEPHGQGWERWEWLVGGVGVGAVGGTRRNSEGLGGVNN